MVKLAIHLDLDRLTPGRTAVINFDKEWDASVRVIEEAYRRIGCAVTFRFLRADESLRAANQGLTDAEISRIKGTETVGNLVRVPTQISRIELVAYSVVPRPNVRTIGDMESLTVGILKGVRITAMSTDALKRLVAQNTHHLFSLLLRGRIDIAITAELNGRIFIAREFQDSGIHRIGAPVWTGPLFHFVNVKHRDLVPRIDKVFREMVSNGEIEQLRYNAIARFVAK